MRSKITFVTVLKAVHLPSANPPIGDKNSKRDISRRNIYYFKLLFDFKSVCLLANPIILSSLLKIVKYFLINTSPSTHIGPFGGSISRGAKALVQITSLEFSYEFNEREELKDLYFTFFELISMNELNLSFLLDKT